MTVRVNIHNTAINASTNLFTAIGPSLPTNYQDITFRIYIAISATTPTLNLLRTNSAGGGGTVTEIMNGGTTLTSGAAYMFDVPVTTGDTITLQYTSTNGTILTCIVKELAL